MVAIVGTLPLQLPLVWVLSLLLAPAARDSAAPMGPAARPSARAATCRTCTPEAPTLLQVAHRLASARGARDALEADDGPFVAGETGQCAPGCGFEAVAYNYEAPQLWGLDHPKAPYNEICRLGARQSPINLQTKLMISWPRAKFETAYTSLSDRAVLNNGHSLQVDGSFGTIQGFEGNRYDAVQFHVHAPSEHAVDGERTAMEFHIVHVPKPLHNPGGTLLFKYAAAAVGILFDVGDETNPCVKQMLATTPPQLSCTNCIRGPVDLQKCFRRQLSGPYFFYDGSVTTPPCTETVQWLVMERRATITKEDLALFKRSAFADPANARPLQSVNGRIVYRAEPRVPAMFASET